MLQDHPIHQIGISRLQEKLSEWRVIEHPSKELCQDVQFILQNALDEDDWARLRKSLSAKRRRRRERRLQQKPVNITLTPEAHLVLAEYKRLANIETLSQAIESGLTAALAELKIKVESEQINRLRETFAGMKNEVFQSIASSYIKLSLERRNLANSCKIAMQLYEQNPDGETLNMLKLRLAEDLAWNELHLNVSVSSLNLF